MSTLDTYKEITKLDIEKFFNDFVDFVDIYYPQIIDYYTNDKTVTGKIAFEKFNDIEIQSRKISDSFKIFANNFKTLEYWELIDNFDSINTKLKTIKNTPKWARSNKLWGYTENNYTQNYGLEQNETLEILSNKVGYSDKENDWYNIALNNDLNEEKYTSEKSEKLLSITFRNLQSFSVNTVVSSISGIDIYGLDINRQLQFSNNDLNVLDNKDTLIQSCEIRLAIRKGSIPKYPNLGINKEIAGSNINTFRFGSVFREVQNLFANDGRFKSVTLKDTRREKDSMFMDFEIVTRLGDVINQSLIV